MNGNNSAVMAAAPRWYLTNSLRNGSRRLPALRGTSRHPLTRQFCVPKFPKKNLITVKDNVITYLAFET